MKKRALQALLEYIAANVRRRRVRLELTQETLAELTGLDARFLRRVEAAQVHMTLETLLRLATALEVTPGTLLRRATRVTRRPGRPAVRLRGRGRRMSQGA